MRMRDVMKGLYNVFTIYPLTRPLLLKPNAIYMYTAFSVYWNARIKF